MPPARRRGRRRGGSAPFVNKQPRENEAFSGAAKPERLPVEDAAIQEYRIPLKAESVTSKTDPKTESQPDISNITSDSAILGETSEGTDLDGNMSDMVSIASETEIELTMADSGSDMKDDIHDAEFHTVNKVNRILTDFMNDESGTAKVAPFNQAAHTKKRHWRIVIASNHDAYRRQHSGAASNPAPVRIKEKSEKGYSNSDAPVPGTASDPSFQADKKPGPLHGENRKTQNQYTAKPVTNEDHRDTSIGLRAATNLGGRVTTGSLYSTPGNITIDANEDIKSESAISSSLGSVSDGDQNDSHLQDNLNEANTTDLGDLRVGLLTGSDSVLTVLQKLPSDHRMKPGTGIDDNGSESTPKDGDTEESKKTSEAASAIEGSNDFNDHGNGSLERFHSIDDGSCYTEDNIDEQEIQVEIEETDEEMLEEDTSAESTEENIPEEEKHNRLQEKEQVSGDSGTHADEKVREYRESGPQMATSEADNTENEELDPRGNNPVASDTQGPIADQEELPIPNLQNNQNEQEQLHAETDTETAPELSPEPEAEAPIHLQPHSQFQLECRSPVMIQPPSQLQPPVTYQPLRIQTPIVPSAAGAGIGVDGKIKSHKIAIITSHKLCIPTRGEGGVPQIRMKLEEAESLLPKPAVVRVEISPERTDDEEDRSHRRDVEYKMLSPPSYGVPSIARTSSRSNLSSSDSMSSTVDRSDAFEPSCSIPPYLKKSRQPGSSFAPKSPQEPFMSEEFQSTPMGRSQIDVEPIRHKDSIPDGPTLSNLAPPGIKLVPQIKVEPTTAVQMIQASVTIENPLPVESLSPQPAAPEKPIEAPSVEKLDNEGQPVPDAALAEYSTQHVPIDDPIAKALMAEDQVEDPLDGEILDPLPVQDCLTTTYPTTQDCTEMHIPNTDQSDEQEAAGNTEGPVASGTTGANDERPTVEEAEGTYMKIEPSIQSKIVENPQKYGSWSVNPETGEHEYDPGPLAVDFYCNICQRPLPLGTFRLRCFDCQDFDLCIACACQGLTRKNHKNDHRYIPRAPNTFTMFGEWTADEELLLLEGISKYGFGNWNQVAEMVNTVGHKHKSTTECENHYIEYYIQSACSPFPDISRIKALEKHPQARQELIEVVKNTLAKQPVVEGVQIDHMSFKRAEELLHHTELLPPAVNIANCESPVLKFFQHFNGYNLYRDEMEMEYNNDAELLIKDLEFDPRDTPAEIEFKLRMIEIYNSMLDDRIRHKRLLIHRFWKDYPIRERGLMTMSQFEKQVYWRMSALMRLHSEEDHLRLTKLVVAKLEIEKRLRLLSAWYNLGIRTLKDTEDLEPHKLPATVNLNNNLEEMHYITRRLFETGAITEGELMELGETMAERICLDLDMERPQLELIMSDLWKLRGGMPNPPYPGGHVVPAWDTCIDIGNFAEENAPPPDLPPLYIELPRMDMHPRVVLEGNRIPIHPAINFSALRFSTHRDLLVQQSKAVPGHGSIIYYAQYEPQFKVRPRKIVTTKRRRLTPISEAAKRTHTQR